MCDVPPCHPPLACTNSTSRWHLRCSTASHPGPTVAAEQKHPCRQQLACRHAAVKCLWHASKHGEGLCVCCQHSDFCADVATTEHGQQITQCSQTGNICAQWLLTPHLLLCPCIHCTLQKCPNRALAAATLLLFVALLRYALPKCTRICQTGH